jgi:cAMP-binding proteins - catabolite gene activator and regulatory subunit of cAMP-dependent protein kinases
VDVERLRRLPLFGELDHHDLSQLMRWVREVEFADGDLLFEQGSMPHDLFVIEEGSVEVDRDGRTVAMLGPGDVVGEMALLKLERRWASVVAAGHVRAVALGADELASMSEQMPELADRLRETVVRREGENET